MPSSAEFTPKELRRGALQSPRLDPEERKGRKLRGGVGLAYSFESYGAFLCTGELNSGSIMPDKCH